MRIALLEDDQDQATLIQSWLAEAGHKCHHISEGKGFLRTALRESYDLLLLDWMVPDMPGIDVLRRYRESEQGYTPVLFVTARDRERDIVQALEAGADDYMAKPLREHELRARVAALARRAHGGRNENELPDTQPYVIDLAKESISVAGEAVGLTHREYELAIFLFRNAGRVVSRDHILEAIWGMHGQQLNTRTVDTHVSRLRKKLDIGEQTGWKLTAIYQHGYRLENIGVSEDTSARGRN